VLDVWLNMFEFIACPSVSVQGKMQGIEVNLCMRLVHYVIMQGLGVNRDWNAGAYENASFVSCVHLRNMSHVSLGCLSLLLHTCIDKAIVPVNRCFVSPCAPAGAPEGPQPAPAPARCAFCCSYRSNVIIII